MIQDAIAFIESRKMEKYGDSNKARIVVWAHNSHVGDARESDKNRKRKSGVIQHNVGQLCREKFGKDNVYIVGFSTHGGTVRAAKNWGGSESIMTLNPSLEGSVESILHKIAMERRQNAFGYLFRSNNPSTGPLVDEHAKNVLGAPLLQRFIGVCYVKSTELQSHYIKCSMSDQYDFIIHVDQTSALRVDQKKHRKNRPRKRTLSSTKGRDLFDMT
jgi:erythromycin esterase-like protein